MISGMNSLYCDARDIEVTTGVINGQLLRETVDARKIGLHLDAGWIEDHEVARISRLDSVCKK